MEQCGSTPEGQQSSQAKVNASVRMLANAVRISLGKVPPRDNLLLLDEPVLALSKDAVWFETPSGVKFRYRIGKRVVVESGASSDRREIPLNLEGTAFGDMVHA